MKTKSKPKPTTRMGTAKIANTLNKTLHLTGIGLAVQAFYINLTLDSALGGEYINLQPAGPPLINPASIWDLNGVPVRLGYGQPAYGQGGYTQGGYNQGGYGRDVRRLGTGGAIGGNNYDANAYRDANGYYHDNSGLRNGYDVGKTYGGGRDYGVTSVQGNTYGDVNGRNKGHQVAGFSTSYQKNESGNKATYYDDGLGHGGAVQYGLRDQRYRDGAGNAYGGGVHDSSLKLNALGNQGQYGGAGGYRTTDNRGGTVGGQDVYGGGVRAGAGVSGGVYQPVLSRPVYVSQPVPVAQPIPVAHPYSVGQPIPLASQAIALPLAPLPAARGSSPPYVIPTPNKLYVGRPNGAVAG